MKGSAKDQTVREAIINTGGDPIRIEIKTRLVAGLVFFTERVIAIDENAEASEKSGSIGLRRVTARRNRTQAGHQCRRRECSEWLAIDIQREALQIDARDPTPYRHETRPNRSIRDFYRRIGLSRDFFRGDLSQ